MTDLNTLVNVPQPLTLSNGRVIDVTPVRTKELPAFSTALKPILGMIASDASLVAILAQDSESVIAATAIGLRIPRAELDDFGLDDLVTAAAAVIEVNADFFVQRVQPALIRAKKLMATWLAGLMPSSDSSPTDTGSAT